MVHVDADVLSAAGLGVAVVLLFSCECLGPTVLKMLHWISFFVGKDEENSEPIGGR